MTRTLKRQPTEQQRIAAAERRAAMRKLAKTISAMDKAERMALAARIGLVTIEGHALSCFNSCMVWSQNPHATVLGGFQQWRRAGRMVRKGEHGCAIWVPLGKGKDSGTPSDPGNDDPQRPRFMLGTVFDIAQTDALEEQTEEREAIGDLVLA